MAIKSFSQSYAPVGNMEPGVALTAPPRVYSGHVTLPVASTGLSWMDILPLTYIQYLSIQHTAGTGPIALGSAAPVTPGYTQSRLYTGRALMGQDGWVLGDIVTPGAPPPDFWVSTDPTGYGKTPLIHDTAQTAAHIYSQTRPLDVVMPVATAFTLQGEFWVTGLSAGRELSFAVTQLGWATYGVAFGVYDDGFAVCTDSVGAATYAIPLNQWVPIKVVVDTANAATFYVNGVNVRAGNPINNLLGMNNLMCLTQKVAPPADASTNRTKAANVRVSVTPLVTPGIFLPDGSGWERDFAPNLFVPNMGVIVSAGAIDAEFDILAIGV